MNPVRTALAFVARRQGSRIMPAGQWANILSLDLGWMPPGDARRYVAAARDAGVLVDDDGALRFDGDPKEVEIPKGFRPDASTVAAAIGPASEPAAEPAPPEPAAPDRDEEDPFKHWLRKVCDATKQPVDQVMAKVAERQDAAGGLLTAEAALLLIAQEAGLDVREAAADAEARLRAYS